MTGTATTTAKPARLREGQVVRYNGSVRKHRGQLFRVAFRYTCTCKELGFPSCAVCESGQDALYNLSRYEPGRKFDPAAPWALIGARPKSVEQVPAQAAGKAEHRDCGACGGEHALLPGEEWRCPNTTGTSR